MRLRSVPRPCLVIEKKVYDGASWVDEINAATPGSTYRFRINVTATCCNFTEIAVKDTLPSSMTYEDSATPFEPNSTVGNVRYWNFSSVDKGDTLTIEFDVELSGYSGCNVANVTANCTDTGVLHSAEDDACIYTSILTVHPTDPAADYTTITAAITAASDGYSIEVWNSTYTENVDVDKRLTIYSRDGPAVTIVDGDGDRVFYANHDWVNITGFTITGGTGYSDPGIEVYYNNHCNLSYNIISGNYHGIEMYSADYNTILGNVVKDNSNRGIFLSNYCNDNDVSMNTVDNNNQGIYLNNADDNEIVCNWVVDSTEAGFYLRYGATGNSISCNNIMGNGVYNATSGGYEWNFKNDQSDAVDAKYNYWVATDNATIDASIYDNEEGEGEVTFYPFEAGTVPCAPIPELATFALVGVGLLALVGYRRRQG